MFFASLFFYTVQAFTVHAYIGTYIIGIGKNVLNTDYVKQIIQKFISPTLLRSKLKRNYRR